MRKKIATILLMAFILPMFVFLQPVLSSAFGMSPVLTVAQPVTKNGKQSIQVYWDVAVGQYLQQQADIEYHVMYRVTNEDGSVTEWKQARYPALVGDTEVLTTNTNGRGGGGFEFSVPIAGEKYDFSLFHGSLSAGETLSNSSVTNITETPVQTQTPAEIAATPKKPVLVDKGNILEQMVALLVMFPVTVIKGIGTTAGFKDVNVLVFGDTLSDEDKAVLPWKTAQKDAILAWFKYIVMFTLPFYAIVIAITGYKIIYSGNNPGARVDAMQSLERLFFSLGIIIFIPVLISVLMSITGLMLEGIKGAFAMATAGSGVSTSSMKLLDFSMSTGSLLGTAIVKVMFAMLYLYFNILYTIRMVSISVMLIFTPFAAIMWVMNKNVTAVAVLLGELASNAFMPIAHGLVICTILLLTQGIAKDDCWIQILIMMYVLIPLSEALRNSMMSVLTRAAGVNESSAASGIMGSMMGFGGAIGLARVGKATMGSGGAGGGVGAVFQKGNTSGKSMPNLQRTVMGSHDGNGGSSIFNNSTIAPIRKSASIGNHGNSFKVKGRFNPNYHPDKINLDALRKPKKADSPTKYQPKQVPINWHRSEMLGSTISAGSKYGAMVSAPFMAMAGAVPGGAAVAAGASAIMGATFRGVATSGAMAHQLYAARKEEKGDMGRALQRVTGSTSRGKGIMRIGATIGGSMFNPQGTLQKAQLEKNSLDQNKQLRQKKQLNEIKTKLAPPTRRRNYSQPKGNMPGGSANPPPPNSNPPGGQAAGTPLNKRKRKYPEPAWLGGKKPKWRVNDDVGKKQRYIINPRTTRAPRK